MNKITTFLLVVTVTFGILLAATMQSKAQSKDQVMSFAGIIPFVTNNDRVGFLDQKNGRIYVYDNDIKECLFTGQIDQLGKPIRAISSQNLTTSNPSAL